MNIHFTEKRIFDILVKSSLFHVEFGSSLYDLKHENSDTDIIYIYPDTISEIFSFHRIHHQFQYKENNIDHIFVSLQTFLRNLINGDSTINFEILYSDKFKKSEISWIYFYKEDFISYSLINSYLGMAKRDLNYVDENNERNPLNKKKIIHSFRGITFARNLLNKEFDLKDHRIKNFYHDFSFQLMKVIKKDLERERLDLTFLLREKYKKNQIPLFGEIKFLSELNEKLRIFMRSQKFIDKQIFLTEIEKEIETKLLYSYENGISYEKKT